MVFKLYFFIFISSIINKLYALEILKKYGSASSPCIFESKDFKIGNYMNFKVTSTSVIGDLYYQYYDDINSINILSETKYSVSNPVDESTSVIGVVVSHTKRFTIIKKTEEMEGLSGNYMLLSIHGSAEIENTYIGMSQAVMIIIIVVCCLSGIGIIIVIVYLIKNRNKNDEENYNEGVKADSNYASKGQENPKSGQNTIIYQNKVNVIPNDKIDNSDSKSQTSFEKEKFAKKYKIKNK